jgi:prepilin peptidase CpaA
MNVPLWAAIPVLVLVSAAARADVRTRKIPNRLTFPALLLGLAVHLAFGGGAGLLASLAGMSVAAVLLPGWRLGWMGAGDVKLMAAAGAWLTFPHAVVALLASLVAGGVIAALVAMRRGVLWAALRNVAWTASWSLSGSPSAAPTTGIRFPFAFAILAGCTMALWIKAGVPITGL